MVESWGRDVDKKVGICRKEGWLFVCMDERIDTYCYILLHIDTGSISNAM